MKNLFKVLVALMLLPSTHLMAQLPGMDEFIAFNRFSGVVLLGYILATWFLMQDKYKKDPFGHKIGRLIFPIFVGALCGWRKALLCVLALVLTGIAATLVSILLSTLGVPMVVSLTIAGLLIVAGYVLVVIAIWRNMLPEYEGDTTGQKVLRLLFPHYLGNLAKPWTAVVIYVGAIGLSSPIL